MRRLSEADAEKLESLVRAACNWSATMAFYSKLLAENANEKREHARGRRDAAMENIRKFAKGED